MRKSEDFFSIYITILRHCARFHYCTSECFMEAKIIVGKYKYTDS